MGWSDGGEVFDAVAQAFIEEDVDDGTTQRILTRLITALQDCDWDTEDEMATKYCRYRPVVTAFRLCGIPAEDAPSS